MNNSQCVSKNRPPVRVLFFEKTPFMGVELLDILKDYSLVSFRDDWTYSYLNRSGASVISYGDRNLLKHIDSDEAIRTMLRDKRFMKNVVDKEDTRLLFFYIEGVMDNLCKKLGLKLALPPYDIQEQLGNKLYLKKIIKGVGLKENKSISFSSDRAIDSKLFQKCSKRLGLPFILQGGLGVSGEDTFLISSKKEFDRFSKRLNYNAKASKLIKNNIPFSVHICITDKEILYEGPFLQIIGFPELSPCPYVFCGNDTNQTLFSDKLKEKIRHTSLKIARYSKKIGYKGILGIDYLLDNNNNQFYVQEINARLVGLTRLLTGIQKIQSVTPHLLEHINVFTPIVFRKNYKKENIDISEQNFSQIYIAGNKNKPLLIKQNICPGIYRIRNNRLIKTKSSLFLKDLSPNEVLINYAAYKGSKIKPGDVIAKIIIKKSSIQDGQYLLTKEIKELICSIRNFMETK